MRRVLAPLGGAISFALVSLLVIGGLTWVTIQSLHVENQQRLASARADAAQQERLALWRLDSRLLPAWGVENNRPYAHYFPFSIHPMLVGDRTGEPLRLPSPLIKADIPDWMTLHFQLDPDTGWESPQVRRQGAWLTSPDLVIVFDELVSVDGVERRQRALSHLEAKFPAAAIYEQLLRLELDLDDSPLSVPYHVEPPAVQFTPHQLGLPAADLHSFLFFHDPFRPHDETAAARVWLMRSPLEQVLQSPPTAEVSAQQEMQRAAPQPKPTDTGAIQSQNRVVPIPQTASAPAGGGGGFYARADASKSSMKDVMNTIEGPMPSNEAANKVASSAVAPPAPEQAPAAAPVDAQLNVAEAKNEPSAPGEVTGRRFARSGVEQAPPGQLGGLPARGRGVPNAADPEAGVRGQVSERAASPAEPKEMEKRDSVGSLEAKKSVLHFLRPPSVQLGPMRPLWLTTPDGGETLILVRAAKLETKIVFQGVLLDWPRLQNVLLEEVRGQFPESRLEPVRDNGHVTERCMSALPAVFDPGAEPPPPPVGWSPLRIGLLLGWIAALLALAAVGFVGWTLIDLSERRIRFVSAVTHELRTPLTSLRLYTDLLSSGMIRGEDEQRQYLRTLGHESERLHTLIENVLDFARLEKRGVSAQRMPVLIMDLIEQVRQTWQDRLANEGRELVVVNMLPPERTVNTDARIAAQILGNLIDNARKYTREAADPRIWLKIVPGDAGRVLLEVEDRGPGVPAGDAAGIFRPFRRGKNVSATGGAGLGLALAKQWSELLGGDIRYCQPSSGIGACFRLELPA